MPQLRVQDFSGGETDRFRDGQPNFAQRMLNLLISENNRLLSRPGYGKLKLDALPFGAQKIEAIWSHQTTRTTDGSVNSTMAYETFIASNRTVMVADSTAGATWRSVQCPPEAGSPANGFPLIKQSEICSYTRLNDNEFVITCDTASAGIRATFKFYREHINEEWKYVSLGLPVYGQSFSLAGPPTGIGNTWLYAWVLKHEYQIFEPGAGVVTKIVRGSPAFTDPVNAGTFVSWTKPVFTSMNSVNFKDGDGDFLSGDPCFAWDDIVWEVYRTTDNGVLFYKVGETPARTAGTFGDGTNDTNLVAGEKLYTTGGVVGNDMCNDRISFSTFANDTLWLASDSRMWQAKVGIADAVPGSFNFRTRSGEDIYGVDTIDIYPIILTSRGVYRVEGIVDDLGNGTHRIRTISETNGCIAAGSVVRCGDKIFYWAEDGIYMTNGYTAAKVSTHYNDTYAAIVAQVGKVGVQNIPIANLMRGAWDKLNRRIYWFYAVDQGEWNTKTIVLEMESKHDEGYCLLSGDVPFQVTQAAVENGGLQISTQTGHVLGQEKYLGDVGDYISDVDVINTPATLADNVAVAWDYVSCSLSFGSSLMRKWFPRILIHAQNLSNLTFQVLSDTDESDDYRSHNPVQERGFTRGLYFLKRWFPKGRIRGTYKTIRLTNSIPQILFKSDDYVLADKTGMTVTTADASNWPAGIQVGYEISFPPYTTKHRIAVFSGGDTLTLSTGVSTNTDQPWQITGIPQDEKLELNGYTVEYHNSGEGHTQSPTQGGANV